MNDLPRNASSQPVSDHARGVPARWSLRRSLTLAGAAAAVAAATLLALGMDCAIYLAFTGEPASLEAVVRQVPQWFCGVLRVCSA